MDVLARARSALNQHRSRFEGGEARAAFGAFLALPEVMRVRNLLQSPAREWAVIATDRADIGLLYRRYIMPLAAIAPLCKAIGWSLLFSYVGFGVSLAAALVSYVLTLAGIAALAWAASKLAAAFGGEEDFERAFKLVAYSATPGWLGGVFRLIPVLAVVSLLASLYGIYVLYTGVRATSAVPEDRALGYTAAVVGAAVLIFLASAIIIAGLFGLKLLGMA